MSLTRKLAFASAVALAAPTAALASPAPAVTQHVVVDQTAAASDQRPTSEQGNRYAEREQQDKKVGEYEGGNTVVIGISGGALVVLLLILLII